MYHVEFAPNAEADVARLSAPIAQQVLKRLVWLAENFRPGGAWLLGLRTRKSPWGFQSKMGYISPNSDHARFTSYNICAIITDVELLDERNSLQENYDAEGLG